MYAVLNNQGKDRLLKTYAGWTERIAKGEVPPAPARPKGVERNLVVTLWDVGDDHSFMHDEITTDKHRPTVNANGPAYAVSAGHGQLVVLDMNEQQDRGARHPDARGAGEGAVALPGAEPAVAPLGQRAPVGQPALRPGRSAQPDARQQGPRVDDVEDPQQRGSVVVQQQDQQVRRLVPAHEQRPAGVVLRPEDEAVRAHRHLLLDAPPAVRQRRERDAVLQRADRPDLRLDRHQGVRPDEERAAGQRLVRPGARHQRRRQDHAAVERVARRQLGALSRRHGGRGQQPAVHGVRSEARHAGHLQPVCGDSEPGGRLGVGRQRAVPGLPGAAAARQQSARELQVARSSRCPSRASIRAAWTSTATAWCGRRSPRAATWRASTCASART